jgi:hypothetical protein
MVQGSNPEALTCFEVAAARCPDRPSIRQVLRANPQDRQHLAHNFLGRLPILLYDNPAW